MQHFKIRLFHIFLSMSIVSIVCFDSTIADTNSVITIRLDGYNSVVFNPEFPYQPYTGYSVVSGTPGNRFPGDLFVLPTNQTLFTESFLKTKYKDSLFHLHLTGNAGSETGDPLLNTFRNNYPNKDHFTNLGIAARYPYTPLSMYLAYRYNDAYSTRFDTCWSNFKNITGRSMKFDEKGIITELTTGYSLQGAKTLTGLQSSTYKHWAATPYYYSPLYSSGYEISPYLAIALPASILSGHLRYNYHTDYYADTVSTDYTDVTFDIALKRSLTKGIVAEIKEQNNPLCSPSLSTHAGIYDTIPRTGVVTVNAYMYSNLKPGMSAGFDLTRWPNLFFSLKGAWDYFPETRAYTFQFNGKPVDYRPLSYNAVTFHTSVAYHDTLFFPAFLSLWLDYNDYPLWETIEHTGKKDIIRQEKIQNGAMVNFGGKGSYTITYKKFSAVLWGNAATTPKKKNFHLSLPRNLGADIAYGSPFTNSLYAVLFIENRVRMAVRYFKVNDNTVEEFTAPAFTRASAKIKIPFFVPFLKKIMQTNIQIDAGPFYFAKDQSVREHPFGNPIGPAFSITLNGMIH
jgi:hypothetical protein